jgi:hypothetical protein
MKKSKENNTNKAINAILGIGTAVVVFFFFMLLFNIIFPRPEWINCYENTTYMDKPYLVGLENMSLEEKTAYEEEQRVINECSRKASEEQEFYRKNTGVKVFIGAVLVGILLILSIVPIRKLGNNIAAGLGAAGIALTIYGFAIGWEATGKIVRLLVLFIAGIIVMGLSIWLNKK